MKKLVKILICSIMFLAYFFPVSANQFEEIGESVNFDEIVENSIYYNEYKDTIVNKEISTKVESELDVRYTISYVLTSSDSETRNLTIIGDENGIIIEALLVYAKQEILTITDLIRNYDTNIYTARGPVYKCSKYTCTSWSTSISYNPSLGCSAIVGQSCNIANLFGRPIVAIICKAGVWAACNLSVDKMCTNYYEELDVCGL